MYLYILVYTVKNGVTKVKKAKNKPSQGRNKQRMSINISFESYDYVKKIGLNVSQFVENAIEQLRLSLGKDTNTKNAQILVISTKQEASGGI